MQMKQKLINDTSLSATPSRQQYFIDRYNKVAQTYNTSLATPQNQLQMLDDSKQFGRLSRILNKPLVKVVMALLLAFVPVVNLFIFGVLVFYFMFLRREGKKHVQNLKRVKNPMETYYFLPDVCNQLGKHCTTLTIKTKDLQGFTFNSNMHHDLKSQTNQNDEITVTIYDQYFYDSFHMFKKQQYRVSAWIIFATILISADILFYAMLLNLY